MLLEHYTVKNAYLGILWDNTSLRRRLDIMHLRATLNSKLSDTMDAVVRVGPQNKRATFRKGVRLADQLQCTCGIRCEDDGVSRWRSEKGEDGFAGFGSITGRETGSGQIEINIWSRCEGTRAIRHAGMIAVTARSEWKKKRRTHELLTECVFPRTWRWRKVVWTRIRLSG